MTLKIDPEFRALIPPLRDEERDQLEANILAEGCRDALVTWNGIILDGHNRYDICRAKGVEFKTSTVDLPNREAAADWIDANQLGRRNLTPDQYSLLRGRRYNRVKKTTPNPSGKNGSESVKGQIDPQPKTANRLAAQHGVSPETIKRDGQFARAVEKVKARVDPEIETKVVKGQAPPKATIVEAAREIEKAEKIEAEAKTVPLLTPSRKDREAATIWEKGKDKAEAILNGKRGTVAQLKKAIRDDEKRAELKAKADAVVAMPSAAASWQIIEGDCIEQLKAIEPGSARLIFADPPYNIGVDYGDHHDDAMADEDYVDWCKEWVEAAVATLAPDGSMWVLIGDEYADFMGLLLRDAGLHRRAWIKWYESFGINNASNFNRCSRHLFYCVKDENNFVFNRDAVTRESGRQKLGDKRADPGGKLWDDVWGIEPAIPRLVGNANERLPDFPTQLPMALLLPIVGCATEPSDLVIDPFSGSGTTGAACIQLGRRYTGIEQSSKYAELSRLRLSVAHQENIRGESRQKATG